MAISDECSVVKNVNKNRKALRIKRMKLSLSSPTSKLKEKWKLVKISFLSLTYNSHFSANYVFDTLIEPGIWFIDTFLQFIGPLFVTGVITLTFSVIFIAWFVGLPYYLTHYNLIYVIFVVCLGNYLKLNIVFYYYKAFTTHPGKIPSQADEIKQISSICKKCIHPKPPRTHHCSVCDKCILKMDHHCPWINGCVGHFNHRYFFLYMVSMVLGCFYVMLFGFEIFYDEIMNPSLKENQEFYILDRRNLIIYEAFIATGTFLILGGLMIWHAKLIHRGQTSIEAHINKSEAMRLKKLGKKYRNPYDFGTWHNWSLFLGLIQGRKWTSLLWPSSYLPKGDGLEWDTIYSCDIQWNDDFIPIDLTKLA